MRSLQENLKLRPRRIFFKTLNDAKLEFFRGVGIGGGGQPKNTFFGGYHCVLSGNAYNVIITKVIYKA